MADTKTRMRYFEIRAPRADFTGLLGTTAFANGVARVAFDDTRDDDGRLLTDDVPPGRSAVQFARRRRGYTVTEIDAGGNPLTAAAAAAAAAVDGAVVPTAESALKTPDPAVPPPAANASTEDWRAWAVNHGGMPQDQAANLSRDQLSAHFTPQKKGASR